MLIDLGTNGEMVLGNQDRMVVCSTAAGPAFEGGQLQGDIREIQLVKSSICTGAEILMESLRVTKDEIEQVLIAGAFGNFIDLDSATALGLIVCRH